MYENDKSLQFKIIEELERRTFKRGGVIPFPQVHSVLEGVFHYNREAGKQLLDELKEQGFIRLIPYRGIEVIHPRITVLSEI